MRNFRNVSTSSSEVFRGPYAEALSFARRKTKEFNDSFQASLVKSYVIDGEEGGEGIVTEHLGTGGAQVPTQPIVTDNL